MAGVAFSPNAQREGKIGFLTAALVTVSVASSVASARGQRKAANFATSQGARMANDAIVRGEEDVTTYRSDLAQVVGAARTAIAASNVDPTVGSAAQVQAETQRLGELDVGRIRANARREAVGLRSQSEMTARGLRAGANAALAQAGATLATAGIDAWSSYAKAKGLATTAAARAQGGAARAAVVSRRGAVNTYGALRP